ncbi:MAG: 4-hydroxy-tetrahydrodipicolinate reductase [Saprospiraceae bacterium]
MQIGLFGYGKMGRAIETIALERGHGIAWRITRENRPAITPEFLQQADLVIEFSRPDAAYENVMECLRAGLPVVCGTTGWLEQLTEAESWCVQNNGTLLWASNFSVGVNLFFALNRRLAQLMGGRPEYRPGIIETHHVHKLDAPSGTARTLAQDILAQAKNLHNWCLSPTPPGPSDLPITAIREGEVPGTHTVRWSSPVDEIVIEHRAHSRTGFASGAVMTAEWLSGKTGVYRMEDVLGI